MHFDVPPRFKIGFALVGIVLVANLAVLGVFVGTGRFADEYELQAFFSRSTQGLYDTSDVKIRGVTVGSVESIELLDNGEAVITMAMRPGVRVADTTVASIEPLSVFGPKFVRLEPGEHETTGPYLDEGAEIRDTVRPAEFTETLAVLTDLFSVLNPDEVFTVIHTLADGTGGLGATIGRGVDSTASVASATAAHTADLQSLLADVADLTSTLAPRADALASTVSDLNVVLPEITERADQLGVLLDSLSRLATGASELIAAHAPALDTTVVGLTRIVDVLHAQLGHVPELVEALDAFFGELAAIIRVPGPSGTRLGALRGGTDLTNLCNLIVGFGCGGPTSPTPSPLPSLPALPVPVPELPVLPALPIPDTGLCLPLPLPPPLGCPTP
ncbi:MAG: MlaD family protein [Acidimicrobiales bacterium]